MAANCNIDELSNEWLNLLGAKHDEEALRLYCEEIVPCLLPSLHETFASSYHHKGAYDGLISLLGFTPDTVVLAYRFIEPKVLVVLHTQETQHLLDTVVRFTGVPLSAFFHEPFSETPHEEIYHALDAALRRFPKGAKVAIELTGGKKTMGGALAVAAGMLDIDLLYIDYHEYLPQYRKPRSASTYIQLVGNPMKLSTDLFGAPDIQRAVEFFNIGKFDSSEEFFKDISHRMATPRAIEFCTILSQFYSMWNSFAFEEAFKQIPRLRNLISNFQDQILSRFILNLTQLQKQFDGIRELAEQDRKAIMLNFYFTALRYEKNGQHDLAALLFYRTIEDVLDNALRDIVKDFDRSKPDYDLFAIAREDLASKFSAFRDKNLKRPNMGQGLPNTIALFDAFCLLGAIGGPIASKFNASKVMNIASIRNRSVYAHGFRPMDKQAVGGIRSLADEMLNVYIEDNGLEPLETQRERFEFMRLDMREKPLGSSLGSTVPQ